MTTEEALDFLRGHQPLPPSRVVADSTVAHFDSVRQYFSTHLDARCVPLLIGALGEGDGHGSYQLVEDTILIYPDHVVIPALVSGLRSPLAATRAWSAEIAANYRHPDLVPGLVALLAGATTDERSFAATALGHIGSPDAQAALRSALELESDPFVKKRLADSLIARQ